MNKYLYDRDYKQGEMFAIAWYWKELGYRVFRVGYSSMDITEI